LLDTHAAAQRRSQGDDDTGPMKLCCVQLFNAGRLTPLHCAKHVRASRSRHPLHHRGSIHTIRKNKATSPMCPGPQ